KRTEGAPSTPTVARAAASVSGIPAVSAAATHSRSSPNGSAGGSSSSGWAPGVPLSVPVTQHLLCGHWRLPCRRPRQISDRPCPRQDCGGPTTRLSGMTDKQLQSQIIAALEVVDPDTFDAAAEAER